MTALFRCWTRFVGLAFLLAACGGGDNPQGKPGASPPEHAVETECADAADNDRDGFADCNDLDCRVTGETCALAPELDLSVATTLGEAAAFLYTGPDPIQKGADPGAFDRRRVAVVRGIVVDRAGERLPGVRVSVAEHDEYGWTLTRPDGAFDLAANGGGRLVLRYEKDGYLSAERTAQPGWQRYERLPEVGMLERSAKTSRVAVHSNQSAIVLGDQSEDEFGTRQPLAFFVENTRATVELPDETTKELDTLTLKITEYPFERPSIERWAPTARFAPGTLPTAGGLHYGLEFSISEADELGAATVSLSKPVALYVENFLRLPVGSPVPLGYYDRTEAQWESGTGGTVVEIVDVVDGRAQLDFDGDGAVENDSTLRQNSVTPSELVEIAKRYEVGATLWRATVSHFSPWDMLFPVSAPPGATVPAIHGAFSRSLDTPSRRGGSVVEPRASEQTMLITGTPYSLHYQSDRTAAYGPGFQLELPLLSGIVPAGLRGVLSIVDIAGRRFEEFVAPKVNLTRTVVWDGKDAFGRKLQGPQTAQVFIGFVFDGVLEAETDFPVDAVLSQQFDVPVGVWDAKGYALGAFSLDVLHAYDPAHQAIFFGWGDQRTAQNVALVVKRPSTDFELGTPDGVTVAPDGSVLVTDDQQNAESARGRVLRIAPDGTTTVVAGLGASGEAASIDFGSPQGIVVKANGTMIVADFAADSVRSINPAGRMRTLIGPSTESPTVKQPLGALDGLALGPREELYIVNGDEVFKFEGGRLSVFAGGGMGGDGVLAAEALLDTPSGVVAAPDGSLFISERGGHRVRKVTPDGTILTVAGTGEPGFSGDGGSAQQAQLDGPRGIALASDGALYIADQNNNRIRRVTRDGIIQTAVGGGNADLADGQLAERVRIEAPDGIAIGKDGALFIATPGTVYRVAPGLPELSSDQSLVPSTDGGTLYRFDHRGRHEATIDAMTGVTELTFSYDGAGRLFSLTDKNGLTTRIERTTTGTPTAIVSPFGQNTKLHVESGRLRKVTDDLGRETVFEYRGDLLARVTDPKGGQRAFDYDHGIGTLNSVTDPTGYIETLLRTDAPDGYSVAVTTPERRTTRYGVRLRPGDIVERNIELPDDTEVLLSDALTSQRSKTADGTSVTTTFEPDPAFGPQSLFPSSVTTKTPSGKTLTVLGSRTKTLTDIDNKLSVDAWEELFEINGRQYERIYERDGSNITTSTPEGRTTTTTLDDLGRITDVTAPGLPKVHREYDSQGRVIEITSRADGKTRRETFSYAEDGFLASSTDADDKTVRYRRDAVGRVNELVRPDERAILFALDNNDNLLSLTPPGRSAHTFQYQDTTNLLTSELPPSIPGARSANPDLSVGETRYEYSEDLDLSRIVRSDGRNIGFAYDPTNGRLKTITLDDVRLTYAYDGAGVVTSVNRSDSVKVTMTHDGPLWTGSTWTGAIEGIVSAKYDKNFFLSQLTVNGSSTAKFGYDNDGLITSATANGSTLELTRNAEKMGFVTGTTLGAVSTSYAYSGFGELKTLEAMFDETPSFKQTLERDSLGRITKLTEQVGPGVQEITYDYDQLGRLIEATRDGETTTYAYDRNGNRTRVEIDGEELGAGKYDAQDRLLTYVGLDFEQTAQGDLLRKSDGTSALELSYDELGNLTRATLSDDSTSFEIEYVIDGLGRRVGRRTNGDFDKAWLYRDNLRPVAEIDSDGTFSHFIYADNVAGAPDFILRAGVPLRVVKDHLGSVRFVMDAVTGAIEQRIDYDEFGRVLADSRPGFQPFGFAGGLYDPDTQLVRFGRRDYDADIGRWVAKDPIGFAGGDTNLYAYCLNDPVNCVDLDGLEPEKKTFGDYARAVADVLIREPIMCILGSECTPAGAAAYIATGGAAGRVLRNSAKLLRAEMVAARGAEGMVSVFHGSINNGAKILENGLDAARAPTFVSRDLAAAQNALTHHPNAVPGLGQVIESRIPASQFSQFLAPFERPYSGFYPYGLQSTEITLRSGEQIQIFNQFIVR
jgi:RHS repeat-associated protein